MHLEHLVPLDYVEDQDRLDFLEILEPLEQLAYQVRQDQMDFLVQLEPKVPLGNLDFKVLQDQVVQQAPLVVAVHLVDLVLLVLQVLLDQAETKDQGVSEHNKFFLNSSHICIKFV